MKKALITGITGQDGSYLAELLLEKGYEVHGIVKEAGKDKLWRLKNIADKINVYSGNVADEKIVEKIFSKVMPDEVYHLASVVEPRVIFEKEKDIFNTNFLGAYNLLREIKNQKPEVKLFLAGSSLMFGNVESSPQNEKTPFRPNTPYSIAKTTAFDFGVMYREVYGIFVANGILFNHESPRRDEFFLPRKITKSVGKIKAGVQDKLLLGDIQAKRDWSFAGDVVEAMWLMLQAKEADDFVVGSGELHSVQDILEISFNYAGLDWQKYVEIDESFKRSVDYVNLCADITKIKNTINWQPKVSFVKLIETMTAHDLKYFNQ